MIQISYMIDADTRVKSMSKTLINIYSLFPIIPLGTLSLVFKIGAQMVSEPQHYPILRIPESYIN